MQKSEIVVSTIYNYLKPIKLLCEIKDISIKWKKITIGLGIGKPVGYFHDQIIKNFEFKQLWKGVIDQSKSLVEEIDMIWGKIPQLGGNKMIA
jgi:hypothetical protein